MPIFLTFVLSLADVHEVGSADLLQSADIPHTLVAGIVDDKSIEGIIVLCYTYGLYGYLYPLLIMYYRIE